MAVETTHIDPPPFDDFEAVLGRVQELVHAEKRVAEAIELWLILSQHCQFHARVIAEEGDLTGGRIDKLRELMALNHHFVAELLLRFAGPETVAHAAALYEEHSEGGEG